VDHEAFISLDSGGNVTKFAPYMTLKLIVWCKLTFGDKVVAQRVVPWVRPRGAPLPLSRSDTANG
jgi:hypothetical protein